MVPSVPFRWQELAADGGALTGARVALCGSFHIMMVKTRVLPGVLSVHATLSHGAAASKIVVCLTAADGRLVSQVDVPVPDTAREALADFPGAVLNPGAYRLKVTLLQDSQVVDNARVDLTIPPAAV